MVLHCGRICSSCNNLVDGEFCEHVVICRDDEVCFKEKYRTNANDTRYDLGCTYPEMCRKDPTGQMFGKRESVHTHITCHSCCNDTDVCNANLKCNENLSVPRQRCAACSGHDDLSTCNATTLCEENEVCYMHIYTTESKQRLFDLGCKHSTLCLHGYTNVLGRRSTDGRHLVCENCCSGSEICNKDLRCGHHQQSQANATCISTNECQNNLICTSTRCQCPIGYFLDNNMCFERRFENERCASSDQCKNTLQCFRNVCHCPPDQYFNGSVCTLRQTFNSTCKASLECAETLDCLFGKCSCVPLPTIFLIGGKCIHRPRECEDLNVTVNGVYTIYPISPNKPVSVHCILEKYKKWTVFQQRVNGTVDFYRTWDEYKNGFGSSYGEYWLGNDNIHFISSNGHHELSIYMEIAFDIHHTANYSTFAIGNEKSKYVLTVTGWSGSDGRYFFAAANSQTYVCENKIHSTKL